MLLSPSLNEHLKIPTEAQNNQNPFLVHYFQHVLSASRLNFNKFLESLLLTLLSTAQVISDLAFLNAHS